MSARLTALDDLAGDLLAAARSGDEEAWRRLVRAVHPLVQRWAVGLCRDADEAEDVAQDTLVRMHRHLAGFAGRSRFSVWLYRITWNAAAAHRRRQWWTRRTPLEEAAAMEMATSDDHETRLDTSRAVALVRAAFRDLPPRQRAVFDLADLQGFSPGEIAELLDMNPATVRVHLLRARRAVRGKLLALAPGLVPEGGDR